MKKILSTMLLLMAVTFSNSWSSVVGHTGEYFTVTEHDRSYKVGRESLDGTLKNVNKANMAMFMKKGRVSAHKTSDGSYVLRGHVNGLGGGPISGAIAYWVTKCTMYGTAAAAATGLVATGVGAGVALAGAGTGAALVGSGTVLIAETAIGSGIATGMASGIAIGTTAIVTAPVVGTVVVGTATATGVAIVGGNLLVGTAALAGSGTAITTATALTTAAVISSTAATAGGTVGFVESCSLGAFALFASIPFLP